MRMTMNRREWRQAAGPAKAQKISVSTVVMARVHPPHRPVGGRRGGGDGDGDGNGDGDGDGGGDGRYDKG